MKKDVCGRIARLALVAICAVRHNVWRAVPARAVLCTAERGQLGGCCRISSRAARYEQCIYSAEWFDGQQERAGVSISCMDAQGREIRGVTLHERDLLPLYSDTVYESNTQTDYFKGWDNYGVQRIITDAQGRTVRIEQTWGNVELMQYEGNNQEPSLVQSYDPQGVLFEQTAYTYSDNHVHGISTDGAGNPFWESNEVRRCSVET